MIDKIITDMKTKMEQVMEVVREGNAAIESLERFDLLLGGLHNPPPPSAPLPEVYPGEKIRKAAEKLMKPQAIKKKRGRPKTTGNSMFSQLEKEREEKRYWYRANRGKKAEEFKQKSSGMSREERKELMKELYDKRKKERGEI
jgi:hypothetical protein